MTQVQTTHATYTINKNETGASLSARLGLNWAELVAANPHKGLPEDPQAPLPVFTQINLVPDGKYLSVKIQPNATLTQISNNLRNKFPNCAAELTVPALAKLNAIPDPDFIRAGDTIIHRVCNK